MDNVEYVIFNVWKFTALAVPYRTSDIENPTLKIRHQLIFPSGA
jgi:hypothetical protein